MGKPQKRTKPRKRDEEDDTPRKFKQLMQRMAGTSQPARQQANTPKTGAKPSTKPTAKAESSSGTSGTSGTSRGEEAPPKLERRRGESMAEFSRRVDQAIPLPRARGADSRKTIKNTKKFKAKAENLRKEYEQRWEAKRRRAEEQADTDSLEVEDDGEDVWAAINAKAKRPKFGEQADRPPELPQIKPKSSIPKSVGSLARRQMLEEERERFIKEYRKLRGAAPDAQQNDSNEVSEVSE